MMKHLFPIAICNEIFEGIQINNFCDIIQKIGYDGIELAPYTIHKDIRTLRETQIQEIYRTIVSYGLKVPAFHWLLASPPGLHITNPNPQIFSFTKTYFKAIINIAHKFNTKILVFGSPTQRNIAEDWDFKTAQIQGIAFFQEMGDYAAQYDIIIAFEPLGSSITNFGATFAESQNLLKEINRKNVQLTIDCAALSRDEKSLSQILSELPINLVAHIHMNDPNLLGPGMGLFDSEPLLNYLMQNNYKGWLSVETFQKNSNPRYIATESIQNITRMFQKIKN